MKEEEASEVEEHDYYYESQLRGWRNRRSEVALAITIIPFFWHSAKVHWCCNKHLACNMCGSSYLHLWLCTNFKCQLMAGKESGMFCVQGTTYLSCQLVMREDVCSTQLSLAAQEAPVLGYRASSSFQWVEEDIGSLSILGWQDIIHSGLPLNTLWSSLNHHQGARKKCNWIRNAKQYEVAATGGSEECSSRWWKE